MKKFTLIELLVVIAIIGILSSMLLPSLSKARIKTRQAVCLSNSKQVALASLSYALDFNETMPGYNADEDHWPDKLTNGYIPPNKDGKYSPVFKCPDGSSPNNSNRVSIAMNVNLSGGEFAGTGRTITKASTAETLMLLDSYKWWKQSSWKSMKAAHLTDDSLECCASVEIRQYPIFC